MYVNNKTNSSYSFVAPEIEGDGTVVRHFPTSAVKTVTLSSNAAEVDVEHAFEMLNLGTLAAASTLTLKPSQNLEVGDRVVVVWTEPGSAVGVAIKNGDTTLVSAANNKGSNSAVTKKELVWDGSTWVIL